MLFSIQYPFADRRNFIAGIRHLSKPNWFYPQPNRDFIHFFGAIRYRKQGGVYGWAGEGEICESQRALRFCEGLSFVDEGANLKVQLKCAFRRFYFDGQAVGKFEVGIMPAQRGLTLSPAQTQAMLTHFLHIPVHVPRALTEGKCCDLAQAAAPLRLLYARATTPIPEQGHREFEAWWVEPGPPLLFLEYHQGEKISPSPYAKRIPLPDEYALDLWFDQAVYAGGRMPMWILGIREDSDFDMARTLRLYILRLHAEHACLGLILGGLLAGNPVVAGWSPESQRLQRYLSSATRRIRQDEFKSEKKFHTDIAAIARDSMNLVNPGEHERLMTLLDLISPRPAVLNGMGNYLKTQLRQILASKFNEGELRSLAFDLNVDYDDLPAVGKADKARELVMYLDRHGRLPMLEARIAELRPAVVV